VQLKAELRSSTRPHGVTFKVFPSSTGHEDPEYWGTARPFLAVIAYILPEEKKFDEESREILGEWKLLSADPRGPAV